MLRKHMYYTHLSNLSLKAFAEMTGCFHLSQERVPTGSGNRCMFTPVSVVDGKISSFSSEILMHRHYERIILPDLQD